MVLPTGFKPVTYALEVHYSILLSYGSKRNWNLEECSIKQVVNILLYNQVPVYYLFHPLQK